MMDTLLRIFDHSMGQYITDPLNTAVIIAVTLLAIMRPDRRFVFMFGLVGYLSLRELLGFPYQGDQDFNGFYFILSILLWSTVTALCLQLVWRAKKSDKGAHLHSIYILSLTQYLYFGLKNYFLYIFFATDRIGSLLPYLFKGKPIRFYLDHIHPREMWIKGNESNKEALKNYTWLHFLNSYIIDESQDIAHGNEILLMMFLALMFIFTL